MANFNSMGDKLKEAGINERRVPRKKISPQDAAKRFMVDIFRPAIIGYDVRTALSASENPDDKFKLIFQNDDVFTVTFANETKEMTLMELLPIINKHNLCVAMVVFPTSGVEAPLYSLEDENTVTPEFTPVEGKAWGFDEPCIAWFRKEMNGQDVITAIVLVPGYRLYGIKDREEPKGVLLEDTNRDQVFVPFGRFNDILLYETKGDYLRNPNLKINPERYEFQENDFVLMTTRDVNFTNSEGLQRVSARDFVKLRDRFNATGQLDSKTCFDEDNVTVSVPWIAYFKRHYRITDTNLFLAFIGAPGYERDSIVVDPKPSADRPQLFIKDRNGEKIRVHWLNYHECLDFPDYKTWESSPERFTKKKKASTANRSGYPGVGGKTDNGEKPEKPLLASAMRDAAKIDDEGNFDMGSLEGITPLK